MKHKTGYLLAHDLGTSGDKAVLFDVYGQAVCTATRDYPTYYPFLKAAEQHPEDWYQAFCETTRAILASSGIEPADILALSFSAQMNACLPVDAKGTALRPAMIWADSRATREADLLIDHFGLLALYKLTGHRLSASYGVAKMAWFKHHEPALYHKTAAFLQPKDALIARLTGRLATDYSDASHLACLNQHDKTWSEDIIKAAGLSLQKFPDLLSSTEVAGRLTDQAARDCGLLSGTPVVMGGGDGSCATAGAGVGASGEAYNSLGTSSWIGTLSQQPVEDPNMVTFNLLHLDGQQHLALGTMQTAGLALNWAVDTLFASEDKAQVYQRINHQKPENPACARGLYFLPYLLGERSPWWNPEAKGCFIGLTAATSGEDLLQAVMEGVGFNLRIIKDSLKKNTQVDSLRVIGGGTKNPAWLSILASIWQTPLQVPRLPYTATSLGAALCAGVGAGVYPDLAFASKVNPVQEVIQPQEEHMPAYQKGYERFVRLYEAIAPVAFAPDSD